MTHKCRLFYLCFLAVLALGADGQERITIIPSSGENEIGYEKVIKTKTGKVSGKPLLVIKEPQYELKTSTSIIKVRAAEKENELAVERDDEFATEKYKKLAIPKDRELPIENDRKVAIDKDKEFARKEDKEFAMEKDENLAVDKETPQMTKEEYTTEKPPAFICPHEDSPVPLFALPCATTKHCGFLGKGMLCCSNRCIKGVKPPKAEHHEPIFFGIIQRKCPVDPLPELSEVQECVSDDECSTRICCGETLPNGEKVRYCRTSIPVWDTLPLPSPVVEPLKIFTSYMQCTPPPPPELDLYPKECQNPMDCFPSLCCQEKGKKFCRPPKKSILALVAELGQRIIPEDAARKFIERIS